MKKKASTTTGIIGQVRSAGYRITKVREALLSTLEKVHSPVTVAELIESLKTLGLPVNKTTVYRELEFLMKTDFILEVDFREGKKRYELRVDGHHHHHLICRDCKDISCVALCDDLKTMERQITRRYGFKVSEHLLEFFGTCRACQERAA